MSHNKHQENNELSNNKYGFNDISFAELIKLYEDDDYIPYPQYLRTEFWKTKRLEIVDRDNFKCQTCGGYETETRKKVAQTEFCEFEEGNLVWSNVEAIFWTDSLGNERASFLKRPAGKPDKPYNLQVHHRRYIINKLPWEYNNDDLVTLCNYCHSEEHQKNNIPIFDENGRLIVIHLDCNRCSGEGYLPEYKHVHGGICFKCGGTGYNIPFITKRITSAVNS